MTEYLLLWLSVCVFIGIGMLTNVLFFRSVHRRLRRSDRLDRTLFQANH